MIERLLSLMIAVWFSAGVAYAAPLTVLVDGSGSMRGYDATGGLGALIAEIDRAASRSGWTPEPSVFSSRRGAAMQVTPYSAWSSAPTWGSETHLDQALEVGARGAGALILITDNFQDPDSTGLAVASHTTTFYDMIGSMPMAEAWLLPELRPFRGNVELAAGGTIPRDAEGATELEALVRRSTDAAFYPGGGISAPRWLASDRLWLVPYDGLRGLAVYLFLFDEGQRSEFARLRSELEKESGDLRPLLVRPLGADAITLRPSEVEALDPKTLVCMSKDPVTPPPPNLRLERSADGNLLVPGDGFSYDPRSEGVFVAAVEVASTEQHVRVGDLTSSCDSGAVLRVEPLEVHVPDELRGVLLPGQSNGQVVPPVLLGQLSGSAAAGRTVVLVLRVPPLVGPEVPPDVFAQQIQARFNVVIDLPRGSLGLSDEVQNRYFTRDPTDLARIFSPADIVQHLAPERVEVVLPVYLQSEVMTPAALPAYEPPWLAIAVGLAVVVGLWRYLSPLGLRGYIETDGVAGGRYVHPVRVGGVFGPSVLVIKAGANEDQLQVLRERWWRRALRVQDASGAGVVLTRGGPRGEVSGHKVQWIREHEARGRY